MDEEIEFLKELLNDFEGYKTTFIPNLSEIVKKIKNRLTELTNDEEK